MKRRKIILFLIILFPSVFWLTLELSTINSKKLPHYGPRSFNGKDSVFFTVNDTKLGSALTRDTVQFPLYVIAFIKDGRKANPATISGLLEYLKYKQDAIQHVPVFWAEGMADDTTAAYTGKTASVKQQFNLSNKNVYEIPFPAKEYNTLVNENYFKEKPYFVNETFLVLIDKHRQIRGYYDGQFVSEVKRMLEEYKHLRLKEEQKDMINTNKIESK